jgi:hypothetical protein
MQSAKLACFSQGNLALASGLQSRTFCDSLGYLRLDPQVQPATLRRNSLSCNARKARSPISSAPHPAAQPKKTPATCVGVTGVILHNAKEKIEKKDRLSFAMSGTTPNLERGSGGKSEIPCSAAAFADGD